MREFNLGHRIEQVRYTADGKISYADNLQNALYILDWLSGNITFKYKFGKRKILHAYDLYPNKNEFICIFGSQVAIKEKRKKIVVLDLPSAYLYPDMIKYGSDYKDFYVSRGNKIFNYPTGKEYIHNIQQDKGRDIVQLAVSDEWVIFATTQHVCFLKNLELEYMIPQGGFISLSGDGKLLLLNSLDDNFQIIDVASKQVLFTFKDSYLHRGKISSCGQYVFGMTLANDGCRLIKMYTIHGRPVWSYSVPENFLGMVLSNDGLTLLTFDYKGIIRIIDLE